MPSPPHVFLQLILSKGAVLALAMVLTRVNVAVWLGSDNENSKNTEIRPCKRLRPYSASELVSTAANCTVPYLCFNCTLPRPSQDRDIGEVSPIHLLERNHPQLDRLACARIK